MAAKGRFFIVFVTLLLAGCVDPYAPSIVTLDHHYLVVEGGINSGEGSTTIKLSRTSRLDKTSAFRPELNAQVIIEGEDNSSIELTGNEKGEYKINQLNLNKEVSYRLRIKASGEKEYLSDYVEVKSTPAVDSLNWERKADGVHIYVNTHDPENNTRYYHWEYEETWEFTVSFYSEVELRNGKLELRPPSNQIYRCWKSENSSEIHLASSTNFEQDVISQHPLLFIPEGSQKTFLEYSVLVRQYALSQEAFQYYRLMKKNTEERGSFFDPQPMETKGNFNCLSNPDEPVIGFLSAGNISEQRIFITNSQLPGWRQSSFCDPENDLIFLSTLKSIENGWLIPIRLQLSSPVDTSIVASYPSCADCTRIGSNVKPDFWN